MVFLISCRLPKKLHKVLRVGPGRERSHPDFLQLRPQVSAVVINRSSQKLRDLHHQQVLSGHPLPREMKLGMQLQRWETLHLRFYRG